MKYRLVGYQKTEFKAQDSGDVIKGANLFLGSKIERDGEGANVFRQFVIERKLPDLVVGEWYDVSYNRSGKLDQIVKA